jgi:hypothetical protein
MALLTRQRAARSFAPVKDKRLADGRKRIIFLVRAWTCMFFQSLHSNPLPFSLMHSLLPRGLCGIVLGISGSSLFLGSAIWPWLRWQTAYTVPQSFIIAGFAINAGVIIFTRAATAAAVAIASAPFDENNQQEGNTLKLPPSPLLFGKPKSPVLRGTHGMSLHPSSAGQLLNAEPPISPTPLGSPGSPPQTIDDNKHTTLNMIDDDLNLMNPLHTLPHQPTTTTPVLSSSLPYLTAAAMSSSPNTLNPMVGIRSGSGARASTAAIGAWILSSNTINTTNDMLPTSSPRFDIDNGANAESHQNNHDNDPVQPSPSMVLDQTTAKEETPLHDDFSPMTNNRLLAMTPSHAPPALASSHLPEHKRPQSLSASSTGGPSLTVLTFHHPSTPAAVSALAALSAVDDDSTRPTPLHNQQ